MNQILKDFLDENIPAAEKMPARSARPRQSAEEFRRSRPVDTWNALRRHAEQVRQATVAPLRRNRILQSGSGQGKVAA